MLSLNWTIVSVIGFLSTIPILVSIYYSIVQYKKNRFHHEILMIFAWIFCLIWMFSLSSAFLFLSNNMYILSILAQIPLSLIIIFISDIINQDSIRNFNVSLLSILSGAVIIVVFDKPFVFQNTLPNGNIILETSGILVNVLLLIFYTLICLSIMNVAIRIFRNTPPNLRTKARILLIAGLFVGLGLPLMNVLNLDDSVPGIMMIAFSLCITFFTFALLREPKLAFILPFHVKNLSIISQKGGIPLYNYYWGENPGPSNSVQDLHISTVLNSISFILDESTKSGVISQIIMENGVLLIEQIPNEDIIILLHTTKSSYALRNALKSFRDLFSKKYKSQLSSYTETSLFDGATKLVEKCFYFIP